MNLNLIYRRIIDKADSRSEFFLKNGGHLCEMSENMMKILFIEDKLNLRHWSKEFANAYQNIISTSVKNDDKSNSKRGKYLRVLLLTGPLGDNIEEYLSYFLGAADNAFADEDIEYDYKLLKDKLLLVRSDILDLYEFLIQNQNTFFPELRVNIYGILETMSAKVDEKFKRQ